MGRVPRLQSSGVHYHVIVRCNNQAFYFEQEEDFSIYLSILGLVRRKHQLKIFNYELMNNHVHLFLESSEKYPLSKSMQLLNWKYANHYNRRKNRKGHFWMDRYKCIPVESDQYALALMRYINRNPIRGGMIKEVGEWKWSGSRFYILGEKNDLLIRHPSYLQLGFDAQTRQTRYREFVNNVLLTEDKRDLFYSESLVIGSESFTRKLNLENSED